MTISIRLDGTAEVFDVFERLDSQLADRAVRRLAQKAFDDTQLAADRHTQSGAMARSVFIRPISDGFEVGNDLQVAPHAWFVHWGAQPHVIRPSTKKALRWPAGGAFVFAKFANHPGYEGDPYLVDFARDAPRHLNDIINQLQRNL